MAATIEATSDWLAGLEAIAVADRLRELADRLTSPPPRAVLQARRRSLLTGGRISDDNRLAFRRDGRWWRRN